MNKFSFLAAALIFGSATMTATPPDGYYDACEGLCGSGLLAKLADVVGPHTARSYGDLWTDFLSTDTDAAGKIVDMYSTKLWTPEKEQCGTYSTVGDCYNREHSFPKSWFNDAHPMYTDLFHLYPTDGRVNGQRSNFPFGECASGTRLSANGYTATGRIGASTYSGYSGTVFEPDDEWKGDFARTYFYMAAAYNDRVASWSSDMLSGNTYPAFADWAVSLLLKWHRMDPVSDRETARNEAVYGIQHNRNPFIDHPELAEHIWGTQKAVAWSDTSEKPASISSPIDGSTFDFGYVSSVAPSERAIKLRGANMTAELTIAASGAGFSCSPVKVSAAAAMSGATLVLTFDGTGMSNGTYHGSLTVSSSEVSSTVDLTATVTSDLALPAVDITPTSFGAVCLATGCDCLYELNVYDDTDTMLAGYPVSIGDGETVTVSGLNPVSTYHYTISNGSTVSNAVYVTTGAFTPEIMYASAAEVTLTAEVGNYSEVAEMWLTTENVIDNMTVSVQEPFQVSADRTEWGTTLVLLPDEDRFYVRLAGDAFGSYSSTITITSGTAVNDEGLLVGNVTDAGRSPLMEDFEVVDEADLSKYLDDVNATFRHEWTMTNAGVFKASQNANGLGLDNTRDDYGCRFGNNSTSAIRTAEPIKAGIGTVKLLVSKWATSATKTDADATLHIEYSTDGENWTGVQDITVDNVEFKQVEAAVNVAAPAYLRIRQSAGKRVLLDNIEATGYSSSTGVALEGDAADWDAYCLGHALVISNRSTEAKNFKVYDTAGRMLATPAITAEGSLTLPLPAGLVLVSTPTATRRVVLH